MSQILNRQAPTQFRRVDWEAIERDYRTGRFTLRELELKHGRSASQICRRAQAEGWTQDLRNLVRQATSAAIIADLAAEAATSAQGNTTDTVLAAAQVQRDVILRHRTDAKLARDEARRLLDELSNASKGGEHMRRILEASCDRLDDDQARVLIEDLKIVTKLHSRVSSLQKLTDTLQRVHGLERRAFGIADDDTANNPLDTMSEAELETEIQRLVEARGGG